MDKKVEPVIPNLNILKRIIKQENIATGRLQSLRLPRDLSLGGTKQKKVYTPNLNVVRNKDKNKHIVTKADRPSNRGQKRPADRSLTRNKYKQMKYVESESVFQHGMGEIKRTVNFSDRGDYKSSATTLAVPKIGKGSWNVNKKKEAAVLNELTEMEDDGSDSESDIEFDPIVLPLDRNKDAFVDVFKIKQEGLSSYVKKEELSYEVENQELMSLPNTGTAPDVKTKVKIEKTDEPITETYNAFTDSLQGYDEDNPAFSLIQLPNSFLGKTWKEDPKDKEVDYTIRHMPEGYVGKIVVRKSGKMELIIRNTHYKLNTEDVEGLVETAVLFPGEQSIALEPSLVTLGTITEKFNLTPEWNTLFDRARKKKKFFW